MRVACLMLSAALSVCSSCKTTGKNPNANASAHLKIDDASSGGHNSVRSSNGSTSIPRLKPRVAAKKSRPASSSEVLIKQRCFKMSERADSDIHTYVNPSDHYVHKVCLKPYIIDKYEVTADEYRKCVKAGKCSKPGIGLLRDITKCNYSVRRKHPVNCVTWQQAYSYCKYVGKRLPTEAEWELAGRGPAGNVYPWGNSDPDCTLTIMAGDPNKQPGCGKSSTWPVGSRSKDRSSFGVYDMAGNVSEWTADYYGKDYYKKSPLWNPTGPAQGRDRVVRGGSYDHDDVTLRLTHRGSESPNNSSLLVGFRCARSQ